FLPVALSAITALRPTSLPVPEVVATAIIGGRFGPILLEPSRRSSYSSSGRRWVVFRRMAFAASSALPPPTPTTPSQFSPAKTSTPGRTLASVGFGSTRSNNFQG